MIALAGNLVLILFTILVIADGLQTYEGIAKRGKVELWGPMAALIRKLGLVKALLASRAVLIGLAALCIAVHQLAPLLAVCAFTAVWVWVVWHNAQEMQK